MTIDIIDEAESEGLITEIHERKNQLLRPKITNVDQSILVFTLVDPVANFDFLDKLSILTSHQEVELVIVVNKMDKVEEGNKDLEYIKRIYGGIGYKIIFTSTKQMLGIEEVKEVISSRVSVLSGLSGVGKSSLINLICPEANMETGEISNKNKKGKHTTRYTNFIKIEDGYVADSPGFSSLEFNFPQEELELYFKEFVPHLGQCRFSNCSHISEPDCGIKPQVGISISQERYERYVTFFKEFNNTYKR